MKKKLIFIFLVSVLSILFYSCSNAKVPEFSEISSGIGSDSIKLKQEIEEISKSGAFDKKIYFFSGGDDRLLDDFRDILDTGTVSSDNIKRAIFIIEKSKEQNDTLISMDVNVSYFKKQNKLFEEYLENLSEFLKYTEFLDSLRKK